VGNDLDAAFELTTEFELDPDDALDTPDTAEVEAASTTAVVAKPEAEATAWAE
jgi:hypothetical protein